MEDGNKIYKKESATRFCCIPSVEEIDVTNKYVKKGEANVGDARKIDDAVSDEELFEKLGGINELKIMYLEQCLKEQKKFYGIGYSFETAKALSFLRTEAVPEGFDILVNEEGKPLDVSIMTEDFIEKIKKYANEAKNTKDMKKVGVELYDEQANDGQGEIINNQTGYNLSKINSYKVALVIPNALLNK